MPIKTLGSLEKIRVGLETGNIHTFFFLIKGLFCLFLHKTFCGCLIE